MTAWPPWLPSLYPNTLVDRSMRTPGVSSGTRIIDCRRWGWASGSVTPMTIAILHRGLMAPDDHHLRPWTTYWSPSRRMEVAMFVASDEATAGSVIENTDRISPASNGSSHWARWASVPNSDSSSMLPVSGAEEFTASGAISGLRPVISARGAYCRLVSPAP